VVFQAQRRFVADAPTDRGFLMSEKHTVMIVPDAQKQIRNLGGVMLPKIIARLKVLEVEPFPPGVEKLADNPNVGRIMVDDFKIVYSVIAQQRVVVIALVAKRNEEHIEISNLCQTTLQKIAASDNVVPLAVNDTRH
jgi:mRNA-degrading endonuclease RelE of RelBE toxin-antitoxin system